MRGRWRGYRRCRPTWRLAGWPPSPEAAVGRYGVLVDDGEGDSDGDGPELAPYTRVTWSPFLATVPAAGTVNMTLPTLSGGGLVVGERREFGKASAGHLGLGPIGASEITARIARSVALG